MIPGYATHFDRDGCYYCVSDSYVMIWQPESNTWRALSFEPDEVVKYLELHELKSFNKWREGL